MAKGKDAIIKLFSAEFRNRLDSTITFNPLTPDIMQQVVDKFIKELQQQLKQKKVIVTISNDVKNWLAERGYNPQFGARPLGRLIQTEIRDVLSEEVLFGKLLKGGKASINLVKGHLTFDYSS
jgi:ATP-dependent Clp protease ATP-binding subunit ClpA